jgi:hypothetical protein
MHLHVFTQKKASVVSLKCYPPPYFFCFHDWEKTLKRRRHESMAAIQAAATMELTTIPKKAFTSCFQDLQKRWQQCHDCGGDYFKGERNTYLISWILYSLQTQSRNFVNKGCTSIIRLHSHKFSPRLRTDTRRSTHRTISYKDFLKHDLICLIFFKHRLSISSH